MHLHSTVSCEYSETNDTARGHYQWPETPGGEQVVLPCMYGDSGQALRSCSEDGVWENTNLDQCSTLTSTLFLCVVSVSM